MKTYEEFLSDKIAIAPSMGFDCDLSEINPILLPHQRACVQWAVKGGRRALFEAFGLGKTMQQIEILRIVLSKAGGRGLIICPLGVRQEFARDAQTLGVKTQFIRSIDDAITDGINLTNYETVRDGKLDPNEFTVVSLDEASVLRSFGSKTYQTFLTLFEGVKYRFVATATPSPNRHKELIHYAGFLGVMDTGQALTRFFQRDSEKAGNLTLYPHMEHQFWLWLHSWAIFLQRPSDLGTEYSDDGYDMPPLIVHYHEVAVDHSSAAPDRDGQGNLFRNAALGAPQATREKRHTIENRIAKMVEIIAADPESHYILWHDLEDERKAIKKAIPEAVEVFGNLDLEIREQRVIDFGDGKFKYLATKPELSGSGCNFQRHCHKAIFLGVGYQFNDFIQAIHRIRRFLQKHQCEIHIIYAESEKGVLKTLKDKWEQHEQIVEGMSKIIREHGLSMATAQTLSRTIGLERKEARGDGWISANNDCVLESRLMETGSVKLIVTSIPFSNHYEYTPSFNDFGHTENNEHFWAQMDYLTPELLRILEPGRLACIHVKDRVLFGNVTGAGAPTISPFHAEGIFHYKKHGFDYAGMITVVTDVVRENNGTYRLGWSEMCKDGTKMGVGCPEYILLFRKPQSDRTRGYADVPVVNEKLFTKQGAHAKDCPVETFDDAECTCGYVAPVETGYSRARWQINAHSFWRSNGDRHLTADELSRMTAGQLAGAFTEHSRQTLYDHEEHVKLGEQLEARGSLPSKFMAIAPGSHHEAVWDDILRMNTLNKDQSNRDLELHVCPLQIDIVKRLIKRYSNEGDLVFDPFGGLATVPVCAIEMNRKGRCSELNPGYWRDGQRYLRAMEAKMAEPTLFDALGLKS